MQVEIKTSLFELVVRHTFKDHTNQKCERMSCLYGFSWDLFAFPILYITLLYSFLVCLYRIFKLLRHQVTRCEHISLILWLYLVCAFFLYILHHFIIKKYIYTSVYIIFFCVCFLNIYILFFIFYKFDSSLFDIHNVFHQQFYYHQYQVSYNTHIRYLLM